MSTTSLSYLDLLGSKNELLFACKHSKLHSAVVKVLCKATIQMRWFVSVTRSSDSESFTLEKNETDLNPLFTSFLQFL